MSTDPLPIHLHLTPTASGSTVRVNGLDISRYVRFLQLLADPAQGPRLVLGLVNVAVTVDGSLDPAHITLKPLLDALQPEAEAEAEPV